MRAGWAGGRRIYFEGEAMSWLLAVVRTLAVLVTYSAFALLSLPALAVKPLSEKYYLKVLLSLVGLWGRSSCLLFNIHHRDLGQAAPPPASLVVANHVGTPDIFLLAGRFPGFFVSKAEIADWPLFNLLAGLGQTIYVDRSRRHQIQGIVEAIEARLREGYSVAVFPEGGASLGEDILPFKPSVFEAAIRAGRPVVPVSIVYHDRERPSVACWKGESFLTHILRLLKHPRLEATLFVHEPITPLDDRRALANAAWEAIRGRYLKERPGEGPARE